MDVLLLLVLCFSSVLSLELGDVSEYLTQYGYLEPASNNSAIPLTEALKSFQTEYGLVSDGLLNPETEALIRTPRCGMRDVEHFSVGMSSSQKWPNQTITWTFYPPVQQLYHKIKPVTNVVFDLNKYL